MFRKLMKNKKAQQTAEYALLISLVVAAVIAMQTYAQRAIQGRIRDASSYLVEKTPELGDINQYEPYYLKTDYHIDSFDETTESHTNEIKGGKFESDTYSERTRQKDGFQASDYKSVVTEDSFKPSGGSGTSTGGTPPAGGTTP